MTSMSLFETLDLPLQQVDFLDQAFDLSTEVFTADLGTNSIFIDDSLKHESLLGTTQESLDDLLQPNTSSDPLGEDDWMEMVDLSNFLEDGFKTPTLATVDSTSIEQKPEEKTPLAFELLKTLLTEKLVTIQQPPPPASPEAQVAPQLSPLLAAQLTNATAVPVVSEVTVEPELPLVISEGDAGPLIDLYNATDLASPLSCEDIESLLSSGPSSPNDSSITLHTIDDSQTLESDDSFVDDVEWVPDQKLKSKKSRSRPSPYSTPENSDAPAKGNKKDRKKVQNKNAATRYRQKKKAEKSCLTDEENKLSDINKGLKDKVESLQREITYMKDLMNEIYKAKGVKMSV